MQAINGGVLGEVCLGKLWEDMSNAHLMPVRSRYRVYCPAMAVIVIDYNEQGMCCPQLLHGVACRQGLVPACQLAGQGRVKVGVRT